MPPLFAANSFSFKPPIGKTLPLRVISPVIPTEFLTFMSVKADTILVTIATPADGPSLGVAPSGTCTWTSSFSISKGSRPKENAFDLIKNSAAWTDSFITSPSFPVAVTLPLPLTFTASIDNNSPPTSVQANPVVIPTKSSFSISSLW